MESRRESWTIRHEADLIIDRPVESVWAFMSDLDNMKDWDPVVLEVDWQRPLGAGTTFKVTGRLPTLLGALIGKRVTSFKVLECEPNRRLGWEFNLGANKGKNIYSLEPAEGNKTKLSREWEAEVGGTWKVFQPIIARAAKRGRAVGITNVKRILENKPKA